MHHSLLLADYVNCWRRFCAGASAAFSLVQNGAIASRPQHFQRHGRLIAPSLVQPAALLTRIWIQPQGEPPLSVGAAVGDPA